MWETVLSVMAAACCLRRKKPKARQGSSNPVAEVAREEQEEAREEAVDTAESDETEAEDSAESDWTEAEDSAESDWTEAEDSAESDETEEESDSGVTAMSPRTQKFETMPDKLFDYGLNCLPPELESLDPSDFLEQPEQMNLALLPKHILARICEMLPPKDFGRLSQTCRLMHWRMIKWCQCTVKELDIEVRGWESNDEWRIEFSPKMALNIQRKQLSFERVNLIIWTGNFPKAYLFMQLASIFEGCKNIKNVEITVIRPAIFSRTAEDMAWQGELLRNTRARSLKLLKDRCYLSGCHHHYIDTRLEHHAIPPIYKDQQGRRLTHRDIVVRERSEIYLKNVPVASIEQMIRYFLDVEKHGIRFHQYYYAREDREELDESLDTIVSWAESSRGMKCYWESVNIAENYYFVPYRSPVSRCVTVCPNFVMLTLGEVIYE